MEEEKNITEIYGDAYLVGYTQCRVDLKDISQEEADKIIKNINNAYAIKNITDTLKYEYLKQINISTKEITRLGKLGWELVSFIKLELENKEYLFKRILN